MSINKISAVMITKNGGQTIESSLQSLSGFGEVIVFDNGSEDGTQEIVNRFANARLVEGSFEGFGPTKNKAVAHAKNDWILIIDADEIVERELAHTLDRQKLDSKTIYVLNFKAYYKDRQIKYCGWNNQKIKRLYNRRETRFTQAYVHESLAAEGLKLEEIGPGSVRHFSYASISDFIIKLDRYSSLFAENYVGQKTASPVRAILNGIYSFFRTYFLKRGFLDGYLGLVIAFSHMATNFYKYIKLYEANQDFESPQSKNDF